MIEHYPHPFLLSPSKYLSIVEDCSKSGDYRCEVACCGQTESNFQPHVEFFHYGKNLLTVERSFSPPRCDWNKENGKFTCQTAMNSPCKRMNHTCVVTQGRALYSLNFLVPGKSIIYANPIHNHDVCNVSVQLNRVGEKTQFFPIAGLQSLQMFMQ